MCDEQGFIFAMFRCGKAKIEYLYMCVFALLPLRAVSVIVVHP